MIQVQDIKLSEMRSEYERLFAECQLRNDWIERVKQVTETLLLNRHRYEKVAKDVNPLMPWYVVGLIHGLEANFNWNTHLHNGDSLTNRTVCIPSGRPQKEPIGGWTVGYTWEESAVDALCSPPHEFDQAKEWDIPAILWHLECYNGLGYRQYQGINSPYLWSGTIWYEKGRYGSDGKFDPHLAYQQVGAAAVLFYMYHNNLLESDTTEFNLDKIPVAVPRAVLNRTDMTELISNATPMATVTTAVATSSTPSQNLNMVQEVVQTQAVSKNVATATSGNVARLLINNSAHQGTFLKQSMEQSNTLPEHQKQWILNNSELPLLKWNTVNDYYLVTLNGLLFNGMKEWYVFSKHAKIEPSSPQIQTNGKGEPKPQPNEKVEPKPQPSGKGEQKGTLPTPKTRSDLWIQQQLIRLNILDPPADGKWGAQSKAALAAFQKLKGLKNSTGVIDSDSISALEDTEEIIILKLGTDFASRLTQYMLQKKYYVPRGEKRYSIVYVQGLNEDFELITNAPDAWNDRRIVLEITNKGVPRIVKHWAATCDPGVAATQRATIAGGVAQVAFGQYRSWQHGLHGIGKRNPYPSLVQVGPVNIWRDSNRNFRRDQIDTWVPDSTGNGINQHHGWDASSVGMNSAGCLVGRSPKGHFDFIELCKQDVRYRVNRNYVYYSTVIEGVDLFSKT